MQAQVVLGRTAGGAVFGAYNNRGWIGERMPHSTFCLKAAQEMHPEPHTACMHAQHRARRGAQLPVRLPVHVADRRHVGTPSEKLVKVSCTSCSLHAAVPLMQQLMLCAF